MQGVSINTPLDPSTHLSDPFNNVNGTKTVEVQFHTYPKSCLINEIREAVGYLVERMKRVGIAIKPLAHTMKCMLMLS